MWIWLERIKEVTMCGSERHFGDDSPVLGVSTHPFSRYILAIELMMTLTCM
jgi:hypothetical protein